MVVSYGYKMTGLFFDVAALFCQFATAGARADPHAEQIVIPPTISILTCIQNQQYLWPLLLYYNLNL